MSTNEGKGSLASISRGVGEHLLALGILSIVSMVGPWLLLTFWPWAQANRALVTVGTLVLFALIIIVLMTLYVTTRIQKGLLSYKAIVKGCGIEGFHPLKTPEEKKAGWDACVERISEVRHGELCLAVFTGAATFACEPKPGDENHPSPLRKALDEHRGDLRILLMQTHCPAWEQTIKEFGRGDDDAEADFRSELEKGYKKARKFCEYLARKPASQLKSIEVRVYDRPPLWKLIIMGNHIWLQHYIPGQRADDLPAYVLLRNADGGLGYPLESVFEYRWQLSESGTIVHRDKHDRRIV